MNRELNYIKEKLGLKFKTIVEYRSNFYASLLADIFNLIIVLIFYSVFIKVASNSILDWDVFDFLTFFLITNFSIKFRNCFFFWAFNVYVIKGQLNVLLTKPVSPYLQIMTNAWQSGRIFTTLIVFMFMFIVIILGDYLNYILAFFIWLIGWVGNLFLYNGFELMKFFFPKGIGVKPLFSNSHNIIRNFTFAPFENNFILSRVILGLFPMGLTTYFTFQILKGNLNYFFEYIIYFVIYLIVMICINIILWKTGLRKYEGYN